MLARGLYEGARADLTRLSAEGCRKCRVYFALRFPKLKHSRNAKSPHALGRDLDPNAVVAIQDLKANPSDDGSKDSGHIPHT